MGARSYSKQRIQESSSPMEATNYINPNADVDIHQDNNQLSGAYIRNLVKQLTTSSSSNCNCNSSSSSSPPPTPPKTHQKSQPHKKQVRRRLHTTKPYQERLLNMAEARKEIVTALKFHRATMKQQQQQQQQQEQQQPQQQQQEQTLSSNPHFEGNNFCYDPSPQILLPNQTLGLNLSSFQDLTNLDAACLYTNSTDDATSTLSPLSVLPDEAAVGGGSLASSTAAPAAADADQQGLGWARPRASEDAEMMEEIKAIGEMHEIEWNDTINLANSAWWFKFLKNMEFEEKFDSLSPNGVSNDHQFEQVVELPFSWEAAYHPYYSTTTDTNFYPSRNLELPCMNIEDIEGLGEEWFS